MGSHEFSRCLVGVTPEPSGLVQVSHTRSNLRKEVEEENSVIGSWARLEKKGRRTED